MPQWELREKAMAIRWKPDGQSNFGEDVEYFFICTGCGEETFKTRPGPPKHTHSAEDCDQIMRERIVREVVES